ncbi:hypothetical protein DPMN_069420 [Dreissena polymorpha]|uniref:DUF6451 domain-containing protein n=1 Tax=Dreissena polymorpha TaxID=45954 RepID=A0A9D4BUX4_DREPO|nr:hypothetical protein DPMN_069420 [Dreissena polymorpha]
MLRNTWRNRHLRLTTKLTLFNSNVKSVLLYGSETWKRTNYRCSSTDASATFFESDGQKEFPTKISGRGRDRNQSPPPLKRGSGNGLAIPSEETNQTSPDMFWTGIHKAREREEDQQPPGGELLRQS